MFQIKILYIIGKREGEVKYFLVKTHKSSGDNNLYNKQTCMCHQFVDTVNTSTAMKQIFQTNDVAVTNLLKQTGFLWPQLEATILVNTQMVQVQEENFIPNLRTAVLEKLQELGDHDIQRAIQHVAVQDLSRVLTDLLQSSKSSLKGQKIE